MKKTLLLFLAISLMSSPLLSAAEEVFEEETFYGTRGFNPHRKYVSRTVNEHVDPYTGNLLLTYTDIYLPGDGGLDLKIQRTYNSKIRKEKTGAWDVTDDDLIECDYAGIGWGLHLGKVYPLSQLRPTPAVEMPDGSVHPAFLAPDSTERQTKELWKYEEIQETDALYAYLTLKNGIVYRFRLSGTWKDENGKDVTKIGASWYPVESITDVHGNQIIVTNAVKRGNFVINRIRMSSGDRIVSFAHYYSGDDRHPYEIRVTVPAAQSTAIYTYDFEVVTTGSEPPISLLESVHLPTGLEWKYQYAMSDTATHKKYELMRVNYPLGGIIDYEYETIRCRPENIGQDIPSRVVTERRVFGRDVSDGTWNYSYERGSSDYDDSTVTGPSGFKEQYTFYGPNTADSGRNYLIGTLLERKVYDAETLVHEENYTWGYKKTISHTPYKYPSVTAFDVHTWVPVLTNRTITRDGASYSTTYSDFDPTYDFFPQTVMESGQRDRTTFITYWDNPSKHILGLLEDETITSTEGGMFHILRSYTANGDLQYIDRYGRRVDYSYFSDGNLERAQDESGDGITYGDYAYGRPGTIQTGEYTYSQRVNPAGTLQSITRSTWTPTGNITHTTFFTYDLLNRLIRADTPLESNVVITYNPNDKTKTIFKGVAWVRYTHDGFGRVSSAENREGIQWDITYDPLGNISYRSYPFSSDNVGDSFDHDSLGRLTRIIHPDSTTVHYAYLAGNTVLMTNERGFITELSYESSGDPDEKRLTKVVDAASTATEYRYNTLGSLTRVIQPLIPERVLSYGTPEGENLLGEEYHPERGTTTYEYYPNGLLKAKTDANGHSTTYSYDGNHRVRKIDYPGTEYDVTYEYDESDNRIQMVMAGNIYEYWYNTENRLQEVSFTYRGQVYTTGYTYDSRGNIEDIRYPSGRHVTYTYDLANRIQTVPGFVRNITYHPSGRMEDLQLANGVVHSYRYDTQRYWLSSIKASPVLDLSYTQYNGVGTLEMVTDNRDPNRTKSMTYTQLDQLYTADSPLFGGMIQFTYDALGNRLSRNSTAYTYDYGTNRLAYFTGSSPLTYDDNGNVTNNGIFQYDPVNRLISSGNARYAYNGDGQRIEKALDSEIRIYHYDQGGRILAETDQTGAVNVEYIYANGIHIAKVEPDSDDDGIPDPIEKMTCTDPFDADTDDDGIPDGVEDINHNGAVDPEETDPCNLDTDDDGIQDGTELGYTLSDIGPDTDTSVFEPDPDPTTTTDPLNPDTDADGMADGWEEHYGLDPLDPADANSDNDGDGFTNLEEYKGGTDPLNPNSYPFLVISGLGETSGGYVEVFAGDYSRGGWARVGWNSYNSANGETRIATGDIDGDGRDEVVVGLAPVPDDPSIPYGLFEILDDDYAHIGWVQIKWGTYDGTNGETWPSCGDVDGDGRDEIIVGLGQDGGGYVEIFDDALAGYAHLTWLRVHWTAYNTANGEARPSCGDVDQDGKDEIVVGLGQEGGGYIEIFDDSLAGYDHLAWARVHWDSYNSANGETWPGVKE